MNRVDRPSVIRLPGRAGGQGFTVTLQTPVFVDEVDPNLVLQARTTVETASVRIKTLVIVLIPMIVLQPFLRVYAQELPATATSDPSVLLSEEEAPNGSRTVPEEATGVSSQDSLSEPPLELSDAPTSFAESSLPTDFSEGSASSTLTEERNESSIGDILPTSDEGDVLQEDVASGTDTTRTEKPSVVTPPEEEPSAQAQASEDGVPDEVTFPTGPSEEQPMGSLDAAFAEREAQLRNELRAQVEREFTRGCISLDGIGYYCLKHGERAADLPLSAPLGITDVSVEEDPSGSDREIVAMYNGERFQLTSNTEEDAFPARDLSGHAVVWQGKRGGHWQIFLATFASGTPNITQITAGQTNNFNPRVENHAVVWQAWLDDNWEIILARPHEGPALRPEEIPELNKTLGISPDWDVTRITHSLAHDMFPAIQGGIVTWQKADRDGWTVYAYAIATGVTTMVSPAGRKSENPRFALVYEEQGPDGQRRLIGYDVASGKRTDLTEEGRRLPDRPQPYAPAAPVQGTDQAALLPSGTGVARTSEQDSAGDPLPSDT